MTSERQNCPGVAFNKQKYKASLNFRIHLRVWVMLIIEDPTLTVKGRTAITYTLTFP